ncbi:MAG: haloacid dehalogenase type II [Halodesulfurarchaeum sp.]
MAFDPTVVSTVTFDSYSTLVDVDAAERALSDVVDDPEAVSNLWRSRSIEYTLVSNHIDAYQTFYEMNRDALTYALDAHDVEYAPERRNEILSVYHELDVFEDVRAGMERLRDAGYALYVVSNGNPEMLSSMVEHANLGDLLDGTISADEVETFKPSAEIYRHAAARTGTPIDEIAHATAAWFDVQGAMHAGMQGIWMNRKGTPWEPFDGEPDLTVETIPDIVDELV